MNIVATRLAAALMLLTPIIGSAEVWAYQDHSPVSLQPWTGNLGMDFHVVDTPIVITSLGAFNGNSLGVFSQDVKVGIFDLSGALQGSVTFVANQTYGFVVGTTDVFQDVTPILLGPGDYSVVAIGYNDTDKNGNTNGGANYSGTDDGGGAITFIGTSRYDSGTSLQLPQTIDGNPSNRYDAGTFSFTATPEPGTFALFGVGGVIVGLIRRNRSQRRSA